MKIVIAGGTGLIGKVLTKNLLDSMHSVVILSRNPLRATAYSHPLLEVVSWDGKNAGTWQRHLDEADAVVNLAGESLGTRRWTKKRKVALYSSRIEPTSAIVNAMKNAPAKRRVLVNASGVGYYGPVAEGEVTEDHPSGGDFAGRLCVEWEQAALEANSFGVRVALLRSGIVLDPSGGALQRMIVPFRLFAGGPLGSGNQWLPWIHREDQIRAIRFLIENEQVSGPVNLVAPENTRMREFSATLGRVLHRPSAIRVPAFALRAMLGEMSDIVLTGQRAVPQKLLRASFEFRFPTLQLALEDLLSKNRALGA